MTLDEVLKRVAVMKAMYLAGDRQETSDGLIARESVSLASAERARAARIARESVADDLAETFLDARRLADQIAADIEGDQA